MKFYFTLIVDVSTLYDELGKPTFDAKQELAKIKPTCMLCALTELQDDLEPNSRLSKDY